MGKRGRPLSKKAEYAAFILKDEPTLGIRKSMVRTGYTKEESEKDTRQHYARKIRRRLEVKEKASQPPVELPHPPAVTPSPPKATATPPHACNQAGSTINNPLVIESPPKKKRKRIKGYNLSSSQLLKQEAFDETRRRVMNRAMAEATTEYVSEKTKKDGKSSEKIASEMSKKYNTTVYASTIRYKVNKGEIGQGLHRPGPQGFLPDKTYNALLGAVSSFIALHQANCKPELKQTELITIIRKFVSGNNKNFDANVLYRRIRRDCSLALTADKEYIVESRRQDWTTEHNIDSWMDNWKKFVVENGFAIDEPELDILEYKLKCK